MVGVAEGYDEKTKMVKVIQKNRFFKGDEVEFLCPDGSFFTQKIEYMTDGDGNEIEVANRPQSVCLIRTNKKVLKDSFMRKKREK